MKLFDLIKDRVISHQPEYRKDGTVALINFTVHCPTPGCTNTVQVRKHSDIKRTCRICAANKDRSHFKQRNYVLSTDQLKEAHLDISRSYPELFIREEVSEDGSTYRAIFHCLNKDCNTEIKLRNTEQPRLCMSCCKKKRPYERLFNNQKQQNRTKNNGQQIKWLLTYEEFLALCEIPNCHYCNTELNRAQYKADYGSTALLLDRKDSARNYTADNCVPCCPLCNFTKNEHISYDEMVAIMKMRKLWVPK